MKANYRLVYRTNEGKVKLGGEKCHDTKATAGRLFQSPTVESVLVADKNGKVYLYLVKDKKGKLIPEKTENISSTEAVFG